MSLLNAIAQRPTLTPSVHGAEQQNAAAGAARQALASATSARAAQAAAASDSGTATDGHDGNSVSLSRKALDARVEQLGDQTIAAAQNFLQQFATTLFGDAAKGANFDFDSIKVSAEASVSAATVEASQQSDSGTTSLQAAALRFDESASFIGHGTLQTRDGQSYEFDIAVDYQAVISASSASSASASSTSANGSGNAGQAGADDGTPTPEQALVGKQLPPVKYPGSLADLFKLLGRQLDVSTKNGDPDGQLSLRLIRLVNSAALLAPRARSEGAENSAGAGAAALSAAQRGRALAQYALPDSSASQLAAPPATVSAPAVAAIDKAGASTPAFSASA